MLPYRRLADAQDNEDYPSYRHRKFDEWLYEQIGSLSREQEGWLAKGDDGERWGVQVAYLREDERLGTAGALSLLPEKPTAPIIVMNADLLTRMNFDNLLQFHANQRAVATMVVREYDLQVPYGVVRIDATHIKAIEEKPVQKFFVNAGIYALSPDALEHVPSKTFFDMPTLFERLIVAGETTAAYPLRESWMDIGRLEEFERAQTEWAKARE